MPRPGMSKDRELDRMWQAVVGKLAVVLGPRYVGYLKNSTAEELRGDRLIIRSCSRFAAEWLPERLDDAFRLAVAEQWGRPLELVFEAPVEETVPAALEGSVERLPAPARSPLDEEHTFDRYVISAGNIEAYYAVSALAQRERCPFASLVITGKPGMGKTHLLHALAWRAQEAGLNVVCLSWPDFINGFSRSVRKGDPDEFKDRVRSARVLIIDDLRDIGGAEKTADELLLAIDAVTSSGGCVVVSAERPPRDLNLPARLAGRLERGTVVPIRPFDHAERLEYARRYCAWRAMDLPSWAIERVCAMEPDSVRSLQGALNRAWLLARTNRLEVGALDLALASFALHEANAGRSGSLSELVERIAAHFQCSVDELQGNARTGRVTEARAVAAAALRRRGLTQPEIGLHLGRKKQTIKEIAERGEKLIAQRGGLEGLLAG